MVHGQTFRLFFLLTFYETFGCRPHKTQHNWDKTLDIRSSKDGNIFPMKLANNVPRNLDNPCRSSTRESITGLGVYGREAELNGIARNMMASIGKLNASLVRFNCIVREFTNVLDLVN